MYITATSLAANMMISNLRRLQQMILDLVTDVQNGRMDTHLLKPDAFEKQLNIIARKLPKGLSLPCTDNYECIREMYKMSRVHVKLTEEFLLFEVKIPLISNDQQYELDKVLPIRSIRHGTMTSIVPTTEYMAVNLRKTLIMPLSLQDITSCLHVNERQLLCNMNLPVYNLKTTTTICEANLINNKEANSCRTEVSDCKDEWTQLHNGHSWLFACCEECPTRIFCSSSATSQTLQHNGILTLPAGCMLQGEHHTIYSHHHFRSELKVTDDEVYIPESGVNHFISDKINRSLNIETHEEQLRQLHTRIQLVKDQQGTLNLQADTADIHYYTIYSFIGIFCTIFTLWSIIKLIKRYLKQTRKGNNQDNRDDNNSDNSSIELQEIIKSMTTSRGKKSNSKEGASTTTLDKATSPVQSRPKI